MALPAIELATLVRDLRRQKALLSPEELVHRLPAAAPTGLQPLDALLGGGLPEGKVVTASGPDGAAVGGLSLSVLAACTGTGRLAAVIDRGDGFDPLAASAAGVDLERLLWARPETAKAAVKAAHVLLASGGFAVVVLDLRLPPGPKRREPDVPAAAWLRLARDTEAARARLVVIGGDGASAFAGAALGVERARPRWAGDGPGRTFEGLDAEIVLAHNRLGLAPGRAKVSFAAPPLHRPVPQGGASGTTAGTPGGTTVGKRKPRPPRASAASGHAGAKRR